jgi:hypothetical protein
MRLDRDALTVELELAPLTLTVRRRGRRVAGPIVVRVRDGAIQDQWIQWTEGVVAHEELGDAIAAAQADPARVGTGRVRLALELDDGSAATLAVRLHADERV